jgi:multidrug efflux pump subunit AcrA (membrane-fusion protein)
MKREVFRKEALERLSSPEQLDLLMPVTSSRAWFALAGIGLLLVMGLAWGIFGRVETTVEGTGLLMRQQGFQWIAAPRAGEVAEVFVDADSQVKQDEVLLTFLQAGPDESLQPTEIRAPAAGRVLDTNVRPGSVVGAGESLISIESPESPLQAVVYVPAADGFKVQPDMNVRILPATAIRQGAVFLRGRVQTVARFPATNAQLMYSLQNEEWVSSLLRLGPTLEVIIDIPSRRPLTELYSGTPCDASIIVTKQPPVNFLLPSSSN